MYPFGCYLRLSLTHTHQYPFASCLVHPFSSCVPFTRVHISLLFLLINLMLAYVYVKVIMCSDYVMRLDNVCKEKFQLVQWNDLAA